MTTAKFASTSVVNMGVGSATFSCVSVMKVGVAPLVKQSWNWRMSLLPRSVASMESSPRMANLAFVRQAIQVCASSSRMSVSSLFATVGATCDKRDSSSDCGVNGSWSSSSQKCVCKTGYEGVISCDSLVVTSLIACAFRPTMYILVLPRLWSEWCLR